MSDLIPVLTRDEIEKSKVAAVEKISSDYQGCPRFLSGSLKGVFIFHSDFARQFSIPVKIDCLRAASYGSSCSISGKIQLKKTLRSIKIYKKRWTGRRMSQPARGVQNNKLN